MEVNSDVRQHPQLANDEPYGGGWLFLLHTRDIKKSVKDLMTDADSFNWINAEVDKLEAMVEKVAGPLAADGGFIKEDVYGNIPEIGWGSLTKTFLKT